MLSQKVDHARRWRSKAHAVGYLLAAIFTVSIAVHWAGERLRRLWPELPDATFIDSFACVSALAGLSLLLTLSSRIAAFRDSNIS
jgi:hypothetical protein